MTSAEIFYLDADSWETIPEPPPKPPGPSEVPPSQEELEAAVWASCDLSEEVLRDLDPQPCIVCDRTIVGRWAHQGLPAETRKLFKKSGILRSCGRGLCDRCYEIARKENRLEDYPLLTRASQLPLAERFDLAVEWKLTLEKGGHLIEMAERLNVTPEGLRHAMRKLGIRIDRKIYASSVERDYLIEEVTFLVGCGLGVHEIAGKFSLTDKELITRFQHYRTQGFTLVDLQFRDVPGFQDVTEDRKAA